MGTRKAIVSIDYEKCVSCPGLICVGVCPQGVLEEGIGKKPEVKYLTSCTSCKVCVNLCPTKAIIVKNEESLSLR